jgi:DNA modification methylase
MRSLDDDSIDLVVIDPPYNIDYAEWDSWPTVEEYVAFMGEVFKEIERVLKPTGSLYWFHNDFPQMAELHRWLAQNTRFEFRQMIVWNKLFKGCKNEEYLKGYRNPEALRNYIKLAEYCMFYTFPDVGTGRQRVQYDMNNFPTLRQYFKEFQQALGLSKKQIIDKIGQRADHCFRWGSSQWSMPTRETYEALLALPRDPNFRARSYDDLAAENQRYLEMYEEQRRKYEAERYTFNNQKTHHSVWEYDIPEKNGHVTPKPVELVENIILHSSNPGDVVLDCFMGSGTTALAALRTGRKFIGFEREPEYVELANRRISEYLEKQTRKAG